jgi:hypothetical protein
MLGLAIRRSGGKLLTNKQNDSGIKTCASTIAQRAQRTIKTNEETDEQMNAMRKECCSVGIANSTFRAGRPEFPSSATPVVHVDGYVDRNE